MASNTNHVCFACRTAQRRPKTFAHTVYCPQCGRACVRLSYKLALPPKHRPQAWQALRDKMAAFERQQRQYAEEYGHWRRQELSAEIACLRQQLKTLTNSDLARSRLSRKLEEAQQQLAEVQRDLFVRRSLGDDQC